MVQEIEKKILDETFDISPEEIHKLGNAVNNLIIEYFKDFDKSKIITNKDFKQLKELIGEPLPQDGQKPESILLECKEKIIDNAVRIGHPRFLGWVLPPGTIIGAYADGLASAINQNVAISGSGVATAVEIQVIEWIKQILEYGPGAGGILTSGGTIANLNAINIARNIKSENNVQKQGMKNQKDMIIYTTKEVHACIPKAVSILGIGTDNICWINVDENLSLDTADLEAKIVNDQNNNKQPFLVIASAGTVNTGAVDPLNKIADICQKYNLWFHVDAAYGGFATLSPNYKPILNGIKRADSIALDPHKWLFIPYEAGCVLVKNASNMKKTYAIAADYLHKNYDELKKDEIDFSDYGIQLSRGFRALKIWMSIKQYGVKKYGRIIEQNINLAKYFESLVQDIEDIEPISKVVLSTFCFRYIPVDLKKQLVQGYDKEKINNYLDKLNRKIVDLFYNDQRAIISYTKIKNCFVLRLCIVNYRTKKQDIENIVDLVLELGSKADKNLRSTFFN